MIQKRQGFTLIELIVAITLFFLVFVTTYVPYSFYQTKELVKVSSREVAQFFYEARNLTMNGYSTGGVNQSLGIVFDFQTSKNSLKLLSYPYSFTGSQLTTTPTTQIYVIKELQLQPGVQIDTIGNHKKALFFFESISGKGTYYYYPTSGPRLEFAPGYIDILISFKGSVSQNLQKTIRYFTPTNIVDY